MSTNQLFVRDFALVTVGIAVVIAICLALAPGIQPEPRRMTATTSAHGSPTAALGEQLYTRKGCVQCHSVDGSPRIGPSFLHDYGSIVALADGGTVAMDASYVRESLLVPTAKARAGFPRGTMPSFDGVLKEREIQALTAYLESLR